MEEIALSINGETLSVRVKPNWTLLYVLREVLHLTGAKCGCNTGDCGACNVVIDGKATPSCLVLAVKAAGKSIETVEDLARDGMLHPLQRAFIEQGAIQCGYCTPGMLMSAKALLDANPDPTEEQIRQALEGNLCRCTGYVKIIAAVRAAAQMLREV